MRRASAFRSGSLSLGDQLRLLALVVVLIAMAWLLVGCYRDAAGPQVLINRPMNMTGPGVYAHTSCPGVTAWAFTLDGVATPPPPYLAVVLRDSADVIKLAAAGALASHHLTAVRWIPGSGRDVDTLVAAGDTVRLGCDP